MLRHVEFVVGEIPLTLVFTLLTHVFVSVVSSVTTRTNFQCLNVVFCGISIGSMDVTASPLTSVSGFTFVPRILFLT
jgi:hypothetical protein